MKGKWSGFGLVDGRGKLNGHVASKNRSGAYVRTKVSPSNPRTAFQLTVRSRLTFFAQSWRALAAASIEAWNAAVNQFQKTNVFGDKVNPTGLDLYTRLNANLQNAGAAALTDPPLPEGAEQPVVGTVVITNGGAKTVAYTGTTVASRIIVEATPGLSPGIRSLNGRFRQIGTFAGGTASPLDIASMYEAKFGDPAVGLLVGVQLKAINLTTGEASLVSRGTVLVN